ncbi:hypothetical protein RCL1_000683 [Eukaryota sp. TZLM3-RCL]
MVNPPSRSAASIKAELSALIAEENMDFILIRKLTDELQRVQFYSDSSKYHSTTTFSSNNASISSDSKQKFKIQSDIEEITSPISDYSSSSIISNSSSKDILPTTSLQSDCGEIISPIPSSSSVLSTKESSTINRGKKRKNGSHIWENHH